MRSEIQAILLDDLGIPCGAEHACPYLEGRQARERAFYADRLPAAFYHSLMDHGWRRSGHIVYKPACETCSECLPIRIPAGEFAPNRTQRKLLRRNADLAVDIHPCHATLEKFDLFMRYQRARHAGTMCGQWHEFTGFLYSSPLPTREYEFRLGEQLVAVAIADAGDDYLSAVYTYFDPDFAARSLGTWAILWFIQHAREQSIPHYYMGYYIRDCRKMNYKTDFRPCELGDGRGGWTRCD